MRTVCFAQVCLPSSAGTSYEGLTATATGWGTLASGGVQATILQVSRHLIYQYNMGIGSDQ
jgi:hypothetical protein